jgi:hypothetical protein
MLPAAGSPGRRPPGGGEIANAIRRAADQPPEAVSPCADPLRQTGRSLAPLRTIARS